jgi:hypothetical protein
MRDYNSRLVSYELIGLAFGISKERVRQIEKRALCKLRVALLKRGVQHFDEVDLRASARPLKRSTNISISVIPKSFL